MGKKEYIEYKQRQVEELRTRGKARSIFWVSFIVVLVGVITYLCTDGFHLYPEDISERLSFAISSLALIVAMAAFMSQKANLDLQSLESKFSIEAMIESNESSRANLQILSVKSERDQITFRSNSFYAVRASLVVVNNDKKYQGADVFEYLFLKCPYDYRFNTYEGLFAFLKGPGDGAYTKSESLPVLSPYFNLLFELLQYIDSCTFIAREEKATYARMIRDGMSRFEVLMLYYHGLMAGYESGPLRKLLEKYHMLENIDFEYVIADNNYHLYEESAFGVNWAMYVQQHEKEIAAWPCNRMKEDKDAMNNNSKNR